MHITFGTYLDSLAWSDRNAALGELRLGPMGMLGLLETRLGLLGKQVHPARRISQYMQRMQTLDHSNQWFHHSFRADPWSTAKQLLAWRDALVEGGWDGKAFSKTSSRLETLSEVEAVDLPLAAGREDRLRAIAMRLGKGIRTGIASVDLSEPRSILPPIWQEVLALLEAHGTQIRELPTASPAATTPNLRSFQQAFQINTNQPILPVLDPSDDSLLLVWTDTEWEAAEQLARFLASDRDNNHKVTILCQGSSDILDQALARHGLPAIGASSNSPWRTALQILPLVIANCWEPVDVNRLVELLSLPRTPVRFYAARHLLAALAKEPGIGGEAWKSAIAAIHGEYPAKVLQKSNAPERLPSADEFVQQLELFLHTKRFNPIEGIPYEELERRCQWLMEFLGRYAEREPLMAEALGQTSELLHVAAALDPIPRITLERMLDSVIGVGASDPEAYAQAAPYRVVSSPGQMISASPVTLWWGFTDNHQRPGMYWSEDERTSLEHAGVRLEDSHARTMRENRSWYQALQQTTERLIFLAPRQLCGTVVYPHPFWDEIRSIAMQGGNGVTEEQILAALTREAHQLQKGSSWHLAGRSMELASLPVQDFSQPDARRAIPAGVVELGEHLSFSQMNLLAGCPMSWLLKYHTRLRAADAYSLPSGNQMIGSLCHRIVELLYAEPVQQWQPEAAAKRSQELFRELVKPMASQLLLEGRELELRRYEYSIVEAVRALVRVICDLNLTMEKAEKELESSLLGTPFIGYADLVLRTAEGEAFVLDLKWSYSSKYRRAEIESGSALQLATYSWLMGKPMAHTGYFLLAKGELLSDSPLLGGEALESTWSLKNTWEMGKQTFLQNLQALKSGRLEVRGLMEQELIGDDDDTLEKVQGRLRSEHAEKKMLYISPPCGLCDFATLCGVGGCQ